MTAATTTHGHPPGSARAALSYPAFRWFFIGLFLSFTGTWMQNVALPAYVEQRTHSATWVSVMVFAQMGPVLLLSIPAGLLAGRIAPRGLMIACQIEQAVMAVVLAYLVSQHASLWVIAAAQLAMGMGSAVFSPAAQACMPMMVDRRDLDGAVSLNSVMLNGSRVVGPSLAAALSVWGLTTSHVFLLNAVSFGFLIAILAVIALPRPISSHQIQGWRQVLIGVRIVRGRRVLWRVLAALFVFSLFSLLLVALYPSVMRRNLDLDPEGATYKWLYAVWGLGAMSGALAVSTALRRFDKRRLIVGGFYGFAASVVAFAALRDPAPAFPAMFVVGFFYFVIITSMATVFQGNLHDGERANVMPLWIMAFGGTLTLGGLMFGPVMDAIGARWLLLLGAAVSVLLARWCDLRRLRPSDFIAPYTIH